MGKTTTNDPHGRSEYVYSAAQLEAEQTMTGKGIDPICPICVLEEIHHLIDGGYGQSGQKNGDTLERIAEVLRQAGYRVAKWQHPAVPTCPDCGYALTDELNEGIRNYCNSCDRLVGTEGGDE